MISDSHNFYELDLSAQYQIILKRDKEQLKKANIERKQFKFKPLISVIIPVFNIEPKWLNLCVQSVLNQSYTHWELLLFDDGSENQKTITALKKCNSKSKKILLNFNKKNIGTPNILNKAIKKTKGEYITFLNHNDKLSADALMQVVASLNQTGSIDLIYSDEDEINEKEEQSNPNFKSSYNLDALLSHNYMGKLAVINKKTGDDIGWFRKICEGSHDYDLFLRLISRDVKIHHIAKVLYHSRVFPNKTNLNISNKDYKSLAARNAIENYIYTNSIQAKIQKGFFDCSYRVMRKIEEKPLVSIIIPFRDKFDLLQTCLQSLLSITSYSNYEILLINNQSIDKDVLDYCSQLVARHTNISLYEYDYPFNYSSINNYAVKKSNGEAILFLNNDIKIIHHDWLEEMVSHIQRNDVGAVGVKMLYDDDRIQHSGMLVSKQTAVHLGRNEIDGEVGYFNRANYIQNVTACTGACLMVKKSIFLEVGGFEEELFKVTFNDVDLCLKIRQAGYLIIYTPYAKIYHYEAKSRGIEDSPEKLARFYKEMKNYQQKWGEVYKKGDPYYNPNLKQTSEKICLNVD